MKNFPSNYVSIAHRTRLIILATTPEKGRFSWLEDRTGIARNTWQTFWKSSSAVPSGAMIQSIARLFPRYAFWLASGLTDLEFGHTYPPHAMAKCFPENDSTEERKRFDDYFSHCMTMQMKVYDGATSNYTRSEIEEANKVLKRLARLRKTELDMLDIDEASSENIDNQQTKKST